MSDRAMSRKDHPEKFFQTNPSSRNHLLAIAIDEYAPQIGVLENCVRDATAFINLMKDQYGFEDNFIKPLFNKDATAEGIHDAFEGLLDVVQEQDNLIVYYAGHGEYQKRLNKGFWMPVETRGRAQYIANSEIVGYLNAINSRHTLLLCDSCFSGALLIEMEQAFLQRNTGIGSYHEKPSRWAITSGSREPVSDGQQHSPFAAALLEKLRDSPDDVDVLELGRYIMGKVAANEQQRPLVAPMRVRGHEDGLFVFFRQRSEETVWKAAKAANTIFAYTNYRRQYRQGKYYAEALQKIKAIEDERAWQHACKMDKIHGYEHYLEAFENGAHAHEAEARIDALLLELEEETPAPPTSRPPAPPASTPKAKTPPAHPDLVRVKGGTFDMGDLLGDGGNSEKPVHKVTLSDFYLSKYAVTFEEYDAFCDATGRKRVSDNNWGRGKRPVINVNWYDAVEYCNWRSQQENLQPVYNIEKRLIDPNNQNKADADSKRWYIQADWTATGYRLPTEAEWEYAAREGGKKVRFGTGKDIASPIEMNFDARESYKQPYSIAGVYEGKTLPVGNFQPNALRLHEMSGNVWEWCWDWYGEDYYAEKGNNDNPRGSAQGQYRVVRGGSWYYLPQGCCAACRGRSSPNNHSSDCGFRLARHCYP